MADFLPIKYAGNYVLHWSMDPPGTLSHVCQLYTEGSAEGCRAETYVFGWNKTASSPGASTLLTG